MAHQSSGNLLFKAFRSLLVAAVGFALLIIAWVLKVCGLLLTKVGELIERAKIKHSS
jgi:hypothetical protein